MHIMDKYSTEDMLVYAIFSANDKTYYYCIASREDPVFFGVLDSDATVIDDSIIDYRTEKIEYDGEILLHSAIPDLATLHALMEGDEDCIRKVITDNGD